MADKTLIAWCDRTFNAWMGCFKVSQGCRNCYAETLTTNRMGLDVFGPDTTKRRRTSERYWKQPEKWNYEGMVKGAAPRVFCASLADVFEDAPGPNQWRPELWDLIRHNYWCDWLLLTKRPENITRMLPDDWGTGWPSVWLGTSIESNEVVDRASILTQVPAFVHFVSYEPAIGPVDQLDLADIEWLICGGESGPGFRTMDLIWAYDIWARCERAGVPFFFKQSAAYRTEMGVDALGAIVRNYPESWSRNAG